MSFQAMLAARAHEHGRAQPTALFRHRALAEDPLCIVAWQLGAEPYSVGAIAFGTKPSGYKLYIPGYPLDRDLLFAELTQLARQFCPAFEAYAAGPCEVVSYYGADLFVPKKLPQIDTWALIWKAVDRERKRREAASVARRTREDRIAYASHLSWMAGAAQGRRRTRLGPRSAAMRLNDYERAHARLLAEEAIDDPLRMAPVLLAGKAIAGEVVHAEPDRREFINNRFYKRPSITLRTDEPCIMPLGTQLWWTNMPAGREWLVTQVVAAGSGSEVTLVLQTNRASDAGFPRVRQRACYSELNTREGYEIHLPQQIPWTHRPKEPPPADTDLESSAAA